jgi:predicted HTH transcriptional regulator
MSPDDAQSEVQKELRKSVTKTITAFLNTDGGTLLIGVDHSGAVFAHSPVPVCGPGSMVTPARRSLISA